MADDDLTRGPLEPTGAEPRPGTEGDAGAERSSGRRKIGLAAIAVATIHFLARLGGFIQKKTLAYFFGAGVAADAATGMQRIFELIYYIPEELLTHSLLPAFTRVREEEGEPAAWRMASLTGTLHALLLLGLTLFGWFGAPWIVGAVLEGFTSDQTKFELTVRLLKVAMLGLFCTSIGSLTYVLLNAYKRFVTPALGDVAQKAGIVIGTVVVCVGFKELGPLGYALGFVLGGIFKLVTHLVALGPKLQMVKPGFDFQNRGLRELGRLMVPLICGTLVSKFRDGWEQRLASQVPVDGTVASLDYAKKIIWMPVSIIPYALGIALFPFLSDWAQRQDRERVTEAFLGASRMMIFLFLPITFAVMLLGNEVITFLYVSGRFDEQAAVLTTAPFLVYGGGLVFYALEIIALQVFYAHRDTVTPFWLGMIGSVVHILLAWVGGLVLGWGNAGIALGFAGSKTVKLFLMWYMLRSRITGFDWPAQLSLIGKTLLGCAVMSVWLVVAKHFAGSMLDLTRALHAFVFLVVAGGVGAVLFAVTASLLKIDELDTVTAKLRARLKKGRG